jgi:hypothetical protein
MGQHSRGKSVSEILAMFPVQVSGVVPADEVWFVNETAFVSVGPRRGVPSDPEFAMRTLPYRVPAQVEEEAGKLARRAEGYRSGLNPRDWGLIFLNVRARMDILYRLRAHHLLHAPEVRMTSLVTPRVFPTTFHV